MCAQVRPRRHPFMKPLWADFPRSGCRSTRQNRCVWPAVERRTPQPRSNGLSFWPGSPTAAKLHGLGRVGRGPLARGVAAPSPAARGTRRWGVGVRSCWVSPGRSGVGGGGTAMGWPAGAKSSPARGPCTGARSPARGTPWSPPGWSLPPEGSKEPARLANAGGPKASRAYHASPDPTLSFLATWFLVRETDRGK